MNSVENNVIEQESIQERNLELFLKNFPSVVSTGEDGELVINTDKLKLALDPKTRFEENGYELNWVGKKEAYHQAYAKQAKILQPLAVDSKLNDETNFLANSTENILIKGDNLEALKLLKASYFEQIKMIYIDPPYNTEKEQFIYKDDFSVTEEQVLEELGYTSSDQKDYVTNIYSAQTHSGWLSFMFPRLLLARDLLKDDGVIFISIDDNEHANLKLLCDEIFGEKNYLAGLVWHLSSGPQAGHFTRSNETILVYTKSKNALDFFKAKQGGTIVHGALKKISAANPASEIIFKKGSIKFEGDSACFEGTLGGSETQTIKKGKLRFENGVLAEDVTIEAGWAMKNQLERWLSGLETFDQKGQKVLRFYFNSNGILFYEKERGTVHPKMVLNDKVVGGTQTGGEQLQELLGQKLFSFPKPVGLIQTLINLVCDENDIILDFFAGSGTTGQAVMDLNAEDGGNRKFILVQLPEAIDPKKQKDAFDFVTEKLGKSEATIFEITAERLRRAGEKIKIDNADKEGIANLDIGFKAFAIADDPMQQFYKPLHEVMPADLAQLEIALSQESQAANLETILVNLLLAEKLPLSTHIYTLEEQTLYQAANVMLIVNATDIAVIKQQLQAKTDSLKVEYISVYSPNLRNNTRDQFNQELIPALKQMGLDDTRLRFRG